jgi:flagellar hook assembly protein FlgD
VAIRIYDILGRQVAELVNEYKQAGGYSVVWNGKNSFGSEVSSGVYFYNIQYNDQSMTKKMMLIR